MDPKDIPAFPCPMSAQSHSNQDCGSFQGGMTLRDYFAAHALNGVMTMIQAGSHNPFPKTGAEGIAFSAYEIADAMLKARGGMSCAGMLGKRCSCGQWHDTEGTLDEPIRNWNVLEVGFALLCIALMGAAAVWLK